MLHIAAEIYSASAVDSWSAVAHGSKRVKTVVQGSDTRLSYHKDSYQCLLLLESRVTTNFGGVYDCSESIK